MTELIDDIEDFSYVDYAVMCVFSHGPRTKSSAMKQTIEWFGGYIEHGPYIYGEYSDDVDESIDDLLSIGILQRQTPHGAIIGLTEYGNMMLEAFLHTNMEKETDDKDLIAVWGEIHERECA